MQKHPPGPFYARKLAVKKLWGGGDLDLEFSQDVNILIGPNASGKTGKTTVLNILNFVLSPDPVSLASIDFDEIKIIFEELPGV